MTVGQEVRERRLHKMRKEGKDSLLEYFSQQFNQAMDEAENASAGDAKRFGEAIIKANIYNNTLKDIEAYSID